MGTFPYKGRDSVSSFCGGPPWRWHVCLLPQNGNAFRLGHLAGTFLGVLAGLTHSSAKDSTGLRLGLCLLIGKSLSPPYQTGYALQEQPLPYPVQTYGAQDIIHMSHPEGAIIPLRRLPWPPLTSPLLLPTLPNLGATPRSGARSINTQYSLY